MIEVMDRERVALVTSLYVRRRDLYLRTISAEVGEEDAHDIVQEAFTRALKGVYNVQRLEHLSRWMDRIVRNTFLTSIQDSKCVDSVEAEPAIMADPYFQTFISLRSRRLKERHREVVLARYYYGLPLEDVYTISKLTPANTRKVLERFRRDWLVT